MSRDATAAKASAILDWLDGQASAVPGRVERSDWEYAVRYARGRYASGIDRYRQIFGDLGWRGMELGLDAGSGAGHWTIAFALDNKRANGLDKSEAFVRIATGAADVAGLKTRINHQVGNMEALPFPDGCFDAVWSHSALQFCNAEDAVGEFSRVLRRGGQFYCGWSTIGFRIASIYQRLRAGDRQQLQGQLRGYLAHALHRTGLARTPWSGPPLFTAEELKAVCGVFGLTVLRQPGWQDAGTHFAGIPATADVLCSRDGDAVSRRGDLVEASTGSEPARQRLEELIRLGLGTFVYGILRETRVPLREREVRSLYVLAALAANRSQEVIEIAGAGLDSRVGGLLELERGSFSAAALAFRQLAEDDPDRSFLLGVALMQTGALNEALSEFEQGLQQNCRPVECGFGAMFARTAEADWPELRERMAAVLRRLPAQMGASPAEADALVNELMG